MISLCSGTKCAAFLLLFYCSLNLSTALEEFIQWSQIEYDNLPGMQLQQRYFGNFCDSQLNFDNDF